MNEDDRAFDLLLTVAVAFALGVLVGHFIL
jgi:hypothetical protein